MNISTYVARHLRVHERLRAWTRMLVCGTTKIDSLRGGRKGTNRTLVISEMACRLLADRVVGIVERPSHADPESRLHRQDESGLRERNAARQR